MFGRRVSDTATTGVETRVRRGEDHRPLGCSKRVDRCSGSEDVADDVDR